MRPNALLLSARLVAQGAWRLLASSWEQAIGAGQPGGRQTAPLSFFLVGALALAVGLVFFAFVLSRLVEAFVPGQDAALAWCFLTLLAAALFVATLAGMRALVGTHQPLPPQGILSAVGGTTVLSGTFLALFGASSTTGVLFLFCLVLGAAFLLLAALLFLRAAPGAVRRAHQAGLEGLSAHQRLALLARRLTTRAPDPPLDAS